MKRKILAVARHEFIGTVTRLGYILTLVGMPLFVGGVGALSGMAASRAVLQEVSGERRIGVVDDSGLYAQAPPSTPPEMRNDREKRSPIPAVPGARIVRFASLAEARRALAQEQIDGLVHVPADFLAQGRVEEFKRARGGMSVARALDSPARILRTWLIAGLLAGRVERAIADRAAQPPRVDTFVVDAGGNAAEEDLFREIRPFAVPLAFSLFLMLSIFTSASYLSTGLSEEKQNRALEMLLTAVTPEQLFWGKLLGLWAAAFLQFMLYLLAIALPAALLFAALGIQFSQALAGFAYFVLGFFFFGAVMLAIGSIGNTQKYTQQLTAIFPLTSVVPFLTMPALIANPAGPLARAFTYIPFTAPVTGMLRSAAGALPWWELVLSLALLALAARFTIRTSARVFRVALLATGGNPGPRQIWAWLTAA